MIRRIRDLLYDQGFTISGARNRLQELVQSERQLRRNATDGVDADEVLGGADEDFDDIAEPFDSTDVPGHALQGTSTSLQKELIEIRALLTL